MNAKDTSHISWDKYFIYNENSDSCLEWKVDMYCGKNLNRKIVTKGSVAGTKDSRGYYRVSLNKERFWVHRVIYEMNIGKIDCNSEIDHLDGDKSNNKISNLILKTREGNQRNKPMRSICKSGVTGVYLVITKDGHKYWVASWNEYKKNYKQYFSVLKLGDKARELAIEFRENKIKYLNSIGYGYTENHGKEKNDSI